MINLDILQEIIKFVSIKEIKRLRTANKVINKYLKKYMYKKYYFTIDEEYCNINCDGNYPYNIQQLRKVYISPGTTFIKINNQNRELFLICNQLICEQHWITHIIFGNYYNQLTTIPNSVTSKYIIAIAIIYYRSLGCQSGKPDCSVTNITFGS